MKKIFALILAMVMMLSLVGCGNNDKKAFEASKAAYENIDAAYETVEQFGSDIYEAWRIGIYEKDEILDKGTKYLASELSLSEEELNEGVGYAVAEFTGENWEEKPDSDKALITENTDLIFDMMKEDLFSFCVMVVSKAYVANGKAEEVKNYLDIAKGQMKELSAEYSDYEHYPNLKGYYTTTSSFFEFCQNPTGSFEQVKDTINNYKNEARDYISDLDYIFEE